MKLSCEIIKDLLPLYHDGVCSNESKAMVEKHLAYCDNCKTELQTMNNALAINNAERNLKEAEALQKLSKRWKKGMFKSLLKGIFITTLAILILLIVLYIFIDFKIVPKP